MKKIVFYDNNLTLRGTSIALYNYADYNERILGNKSIIISKPDDYINLAKNKFTDRFETYFMWYNTTEFQNFMNQNEIDYFYVIKEGSMADGILLTETPTLVHSVFCKNEPHGHKYTYVSDWLAKNQGYNPETHSVPHMVEKLPETNKNLREEIGIPRNKLVFGYYGGSTEFNINFAQKTIEKISKERDDIVFLFMNINKFCDDSSNIIHLPGTWNLELKASFVRACNGMIHARQHGETFGLACGEFALENKPIITYFGSSERNHIDVLGERGLYYNDEEELYEILTNFSNHIKYDDYDLPYKQFSPEIIMDKFNKIFLS